MSHILRQLMLACLVLTVLLSEPAPAQRTTMDSLLSRAGSFLATRQIDSAQILYREALDINDTSEVALTGLGRALMAEHDWGAAADVFEKALRPRAPNLQLHYLLGISYRELGTTKAFLLRTFDWNTSRDHFETVLSADSSYEDVLYQYALLQQYRENYHAAIDLGHRQVRLRPDLDRVRTGLFKLYRHFIAVDNEEATRWLSGQETPLDRYFLGEAWRRDGKLDSAEQLFQDLTYALGMGLPQPVFLSLARIAASRERPDLAEAYHLCAIEDLVSPLGADLVFEDIKYLLTDREMAFYDSLRTVGKKAAFFRAFWAVRNPSGGTQNPRIGEHYRRLVYAEQNYDYGGFRTQFTNPDWMKYLKFPACFALNAEFNDKGFVFLRQGEPTNIIRGPVTASEPHESWLYEETDVQHRRVFHFAKTNSPANNWRLTALPSDPEILSDLAIWDPRYGEILRSNISAQFRLEDELREEAEGTVLEAFSTDSHTWKKETTTFALAYSVDAFRGIGSKTQLDIGYAIPLAPLRNVNAGMSSAISVEIGIAVRSLTSNVVVNALDTVYISTSFAGSQSYVNLYRYRVSPGSYSVSMHVRPLGTTLYGSWNLSRTIPSFADTQLCVSDLQLLMPSTRKSELEFDGIKVMPSPFHQHAVDRPLYTYLQIYNLARDTEEKSAYQATYRLTPRVTQRAGLQQNEAGAGGETREMGKSFEVTAEENATEFKKIDVSDVEPGVYTLSVVILDRRSGRSITQERTIELFEP